MMSMVLFAACGSTPAEEATTEEATTEETTTEEATTEEATTEGTELVLVTDIGTIDDKSFNQGAWEGLVQYAEENGISHQYIQPTEKTHDAYVSAIDLAVTAGAKLIVTPGYLFETAIYAAQDSYPDVKFVLLDGAPNDGNWEQEGGPTYNTGANTVAIFYDEAQSGFLAGYAAVKDGNTNLGFMGGMAVPAVIRFGYGFVQGAEYAAQEMGLEAGSITMKYHYTGAFEASPEAQAMAAAWYNEGTEVIFACGGALGNSVMAAAEESGAKVIGVDVDQSAESDTVITSAMKGLGASVYDSITDFYADSFKGGETIVFDASANGVEIAMETARFETFTQEDYDAIFAALVDGTVGELVDEPSEDAMITSTEMALTAVVMDEVK